MRKKNDWRYLVVLLILLALAMLGSRTQAESLAAQREQDALARGLQLKTTVSLDWDGAPFADEETGGMLRSVLENSWFVLLRETPEDGGALYSFDWQLQGASVLDWTGMRQNGGLLEQSNLWGGRTVRSAAKTIDFAAVWNAWCEDALTSTVTPLADMTAQITVLTQPEAVSLLDALCAAVDGADWLWQPSLPQTDGADEAAAQLQTLRDALRALPQTLGARVDANDALVFCVDRDAEENVVCRQMDAMLAEGTFRAEWTLAEDGRLTGVTGAGEIAGVPLTIDGILTYDTARNNSREEISGAVRIQYGAVSFALEWTDTATGERTDYTRTRNGTLTLALADGRTGAIAVAAKTTAVKGADARIDGGEEIVDLDALDETARQEWYDGLRESLAQTVYTVLGRLPKETAAWLLEKIQ